VEEEGKGGVVVVGGIKEGVNEWTIKRTREDEESSCRVYFTGNLSEID